MGETDMLRSLAVAAALLIPSAVAAGPKEEMMAADRAFSEMSLKSGAHAAFLAFMSDDVRLFDGDHPPILGKAAAAAYYADVEKKNPNGEKSSTLQWTPLEADASPDGVLGFTRGADLVCLVNVTGEPVALPTGHDVLLASGPLVDGRLPAATSVWLHKPQA